MTRGVTARSEAPVGRRARRQLRTALEEAIALLGGDGGFVYLRSSDPGSLAMTMSVGLERHPSGRALQRMRLPVNAGLVGVALRELEVASSGDYQGDERIVRDSQADRFMREADAHSLIIAPLIDGAAATGAMGIFARSRDAFDAGHSVLAKTLADHVMGAIRTGDLVRSWRRPGGSCRAASASSRRSARSRPG